MNMTHYMQLLAENQPWNLILFMAVPVVLAETVAITELFILLHRPAGGTLVNVNRAASVAAGAYFAVVFVYLMVNAVLPLTRGGEWRGPADVIAVGSYLAGVLPLGAMALIDLRWIGTGWSTETRLARHALAVAAFLVVAHVAMIFGMLDPAVLGAAAAPHGAPHAGH
ncbi:DUF6803 family protein [Piscinibacter sp.]|uniref:DUF6803 family protein n=1 Tax=Piscinibacter sp. TaxID=1903157 RepID=UPI0039E3B369